MHLLEELEWRGVVYDTTEGLSDVLAREHVIAYCGFDPTAASLHVGSLLPIMSLARLQRHGHTPIALVGGGTGLIGDPSGKSQERSLQTFEQVEENARGLRRQLERFLDFSPAISNAARLRNNVEWLRPIGFLDFLRDVGKHFTVNYMMAKESVKRRLGGEEGISFTEFSYQLLQAYDYLVLHDRERCSLQLGGSDQWGNIVAGCDLIRKVRGRRVHGLVLPLVTTTSGTKFGKTEAGTVWLDAALTSVETFYQFWLNTDDRDVVRYLKFFTFLDRHAVAQLEETLRVAPEKREAQRTLAREVTRIVHGQGELERAERAAAALFGVTPEPGGLTLTGYPPEVLIEGVTRLPASDFTEGMPITELLLRLHLASSKSNAVRLVRQGGVYLNEERVLDEWRQVNVGDSHEGLIRVRKGSRDRRLVQLV